MYQFKPVTARIAQMHQMVRDRVIQVDAERARLVTESYQKNEHVLPMIRRARATYDLCAGMTIRVEDFELIVGNKASCFCGAPVFPEWEGAGWIPPMVEKGVWTLREDGLYHNPEGEELRLSISPEDVDALRAIAPYWKDHTISTTANAWQPAGYEELCALEVCANDNVRKPLMMMSAGHLTAGFEKIITCGYAAIRDEAQRWLDAHVNDLMGEDVEKSMFYTAVTITCDAVSLLVQRYASACCEKADTCGDAGRKAELLHMADGLDWIAERPARSFWEACQAAALYQLFLGIDSKIPASSFGRFDQYTWPFLESDLKAGRLTPDEAQEIVDAFFLKANCYYTPAHPSVAVITGIGNTYQHTTVGGVDPDTGEDASNAISYMALETLGRLSLHDPTISLRVNQHTPEKLWDCALETSRLVGGLPLFQNDDVVIPGLMRELGFSLYDARNYALIGCQEITGSGNDYSACNGISPPYASIHYGVVLAMALNNGVNPWNGAQCSIHTGHLYDMKSLDEVKAAFAQLARYVTRAQVSINNYTEYLTRYHATLPALSISMEGCMERGKDATWGGCKYNSYGGTATGLATVADSLTTIRYMVFDKKLCSARELYDAVMANWDGYEDLRQRILHEVPHYGNGDSYADAQMKWVCDTYYDICKECHSVNARHFKAGLYSASDHVYQGYHTWATPDGRKTGEPMADATSPAQGRDVNGPTAVCASAHCYDHSKFMDGMALNIRIHPASLQREDGVAKLKDLTKVYLNQGGMEIQYNIVSAETMRAAQKNPENYRNLVVRIAGYSAYFVELSQDCQNDIIRRTENVL